MDRDRVKTKQGHPMHISYKIYGKTVFYDLYHADDFDKKTFKPKKNCVLFRVKSDFRNVIDIMPIVCINPHRNLVYFLNDYDIEESGWDNKGCKLTYDFNLVYDHTQ